MRTKFWRFAYEASEFASIINSDELPFPEFRKWPNAKNGSRGQIIEDLKIGDFILLANFDCPSETGTVKAVGQVITKNNNEIVMHWKKVIPSRSLTPNIQGGVNVWNTEGVFCFDVEPARRYRLVEFAQKLFGSGA
ncbi:hypothetical protein IVE04_11100 [Pseudomonas mendocina]|nr:hypothetical protein [Pseudomonas mendocina]